MFETTLPNVLGGGRARFADYLDRLAAVIGHADRIAPLRAYCTGLATPEIRKSVESIAAHLAPQAARAAHQSLHHFVSASNWSDRAVLGVARDHALPALAQRRERLAWVMCDSGMVKKGTHTAGVFRKYCARVGRRTNCQSAVMLFVCAEQAALPIALRLYLPETWTSDWPRRRGAGIPDSIRFQTRADIAIQQIRQAIADGVSPGVVSAGPLYGDDARFRRTLSGLGLPYIVGVKETTELFSAAPPVLSSLRAGPLPSTARPERPMSAKALGAALSMRAFRPLHWRKMGEPMVSRFAALRVLPATRAGQQQKAEPEWLLIEWPEGEAAPQRYWLSTLPEDTGIDELVELAMRAWEGEAGYRALKDEIGLGHYEGRGWRGFHHHAALCVAVYAFLLRERMARIESPETPRRAGAVL
ncbi:MAG: IS701 family transposase [Alphaproteobacteria bacterium]